MQLRLVPRSSAHRRSSELEYICTLSSLKAQANSYIGLIDFYPLK